MPPRANATLVGVRAGGRLDEWESSSAAPADRWAGAIRGYYRETTTRETSAGGATDVLLKRELILDVADVRELGLDTGDVLRFTRDGDTATVLEARPKTIPTVELAGLPRRLQTARIRLEDV